MGDPGQRGLARLYAVCEDADAELGGLAAELEAGQLRSLVTDVLGALSALQWYAVKRLGGIPGQDDDGQGTLSTRVSSGQGGEAIAWPELWSMATSDQVLNVSHHV